MLHDKKKIQSRTREVKILKCFKKQAEIFSELYELDNLKEVGALFPGF
jgi:hypothetical protein